LETVLAGDIGGTNARFILFENGEVVESSFSALAVNEYPDLADTIAAYLTDAGIDSVSKIALSVASTAEYQDAMEFTNTNVSFSLSNLVARFKLRKARVVNDFTAAALGVVNLPDRHLQEIHKGDDDPLGPKAVIGPGTGLGVSGLIYSGSHWVPLQGQGGHVTIGAQTDRELAILNELSREYGHVSAERYLSGPGIVRVYQAICAIDALETRFDNAQFITDAAMDKTCAVSEEVMALFFKLLGKVSSDLAVSLGASGGIYLAGGIVPKLGDYFTQSDFLGLLHNKGRFSEFVADIPVRIIVGGEPALYGAHRSLDSHYDTFGYTVYAC